MPSAVVQALPLGIAASVILAVSALNYSGFCFQQVAYLSDDALIRIALAHKAGSIKGLENGASVEEIANFLHANERCCRRDGGAAFSGNTILDRLTGSAFHSVRIVYELTPARAAESARDGSFHEAYIGVNSCGKVVETTGIRLTSGEARRELQ